VLDYIILKHHVTMSNEGEDTSNFVAVIVERNNIIFISANAHVREKARWLDNEGVCKIINALSNTETLFGKRTTDSIRLWLFYNGSDYDDMDAGFQPCISCASTLVGCVMTYLRQKYRTNNMAEQSFIANVESDLWQRLVSRPSLFTSWETIVEKIALWIAVLVIESTGSVESPAGLQLFLDPIALEEICNYSDEHLPPFLRIESPTLNEARQISKDDYDLSSGMFP
jgi:hypothetical protein